MHCNQGVLHRVRHAYDASLLLVGRGGPRCSQLERVDIAPDTLLPDYRTWLVDRLARAKSFIADARPPAQRQLSQNINGVLTFMSSDEHRAPLSIVKPADLRR